MGQALYRKYRSKGFDEVIGQDHVVRTLQNALKSGRISHAYLFTGPKGVGKTSVARILAREVNSLPYDDETTHLDIIEIDAASNRRIDEIRELRERVHIAPTSAKYKVYIIDEVHMLTREAFNALLKTLEEPPAHCIFILATTEAHKLPETIVSRTQRFNFKPGDQKTASAHLLNIAKREKIDIEPEALELLAEHGGGSFRDSISLLDQLSGLGGKITVDKAREFLGLPPARAVEKLLDDIKNGDLSDAVQTIDDLRGQGVDPSMTAKALGGGLRDKLMDGDSPDWSLRLLRRLSRVASAADPQAALEIDVLEAANSNQTLKETGSVIDKEPAEDVPEESSEEAEPPTQDQVTETQNYTSAPEPVMDMKLDNWPKILDKVKAEAPSLYTALRLAEPRLENGRLVLAFQFPLHQKKVVQAKNIDLLGKIIEAMTGTKLKIECVVDKKLKLTTEKPTSTATNTDGDNDESLQAISNIFGTAEVLES